MVALSVLEHAIALSVEGRLDARSAQRLRAMIDHVDFDEITQFTLDLTDVEIVDAPGFGAIIALVRETDAAKVELTIDSDTSHPSWNQLRAFGVHRVANLRAAAA
jgi:anti-anti-sigma factor